MITNNKKFNDGFIKAKNMILDSYRFGYKDNSIQEKDINYFYNMTDYGCVVKGYYNNQVCEAIVLKEE